MLTILNHQEEFSASDNYVMRIAITERHIVITNRADDFSPKAITERHIATWRMEVARSTHR
jgi:hypothetical protein